MPVDLTPILIHLPAWILVLFRIAGIFFFAPLLSSDLIPRQVKVFLVVGLSFCIYPMLIDPTQPAATLVRPFIGAELSLWYLVPMIAVEILIGLVIGFAANLPLIGMQIGGQIIDQQMGLALAQVYSPEVGDQASLIGRIFFLLALTIFIIFGGERYLLMLLVNTFNHIPLGGFTGFTAVVDLLIGLMAIIFELAIQIAIPLICLMLLVTCAMGFIARTMPQFNILSVGFAVRILVGALILLVLLPRVGTIFISAIREVFFRLSVFVGM